MSEAPINVVALSGNPRAGSRTAAFALAAAEAVAAELGTPDVALLDLADPGLDHDDVRATVAGATVAVVASPTFKGTYTGLLKSVLDLYEPGALEGLVAVPLMVHAGTGHGLAGDVHLRPLLLELGATCPTPAIVARERELDDRDALLETWLARCGWALRAVTAAARQPLEHAGVER